MDDFHSSPFRRYLIFSVLVVVAMAAPVICLGSIPEKPQDPSCMQPIENADFLASFDWTNESGKSIAMEIRVGKGGAQIFEAASSSKKCVAVCSLKAPANRKPAAAPYPAAIDMDCQSAGFTGLASPAALLFPLQGQSVLRFGSWVSGYRDATLEVGTDHLSAKLGS